MDKGPDSIGTNIFEESYNIVRFRQVKYIFYLSLFASDRV